MSRGLNALWIYQVNLITHRDSVFARVPDSLWDLGPVKISNELVGCCDVCIGKHVFKWNMACLHAGKFLDFRFKAR